MSTSDIIRTVGSGVGILVAAGALVWFFAGLEGRVRRLEEQVHTLTVAPVIASSQPTSSSAPSGSVQNPISETCAKLALQAAEALKNSRPLTEAEPVQELMQKLDCTAK